MADGQTFLTGFAQAFNAARARTEEQKADQENLMFKYKMDSLMEQKKKREAKSAVEAENARKAKDLAGQMGDNDSASMFYKELSNGVDYETLQKRIVEGDYQKNANYKAPTQTIKMPSAVTMEYDADTSPLAPTGTGLLARGAQRQYDRQMESVNKRIDSIDPTLRKEDIKQNEFSVTQDDTNAKYTYKPKNQYKLGDYGDALYKLNKAQQSGDPVAIREASDEVKIHQRIMSEKAYQEGLSNGKNVSQWFSLNDDGSINAQFTGEVRQDGLYNISGAQEQLVSGPVRRMEKADMDRYNQLQDNFGKQSADYNLASTNFIGALDSSQQMAEILHNDRSAATMTSGILATVESLSGEARAAAEALTGIENKINSNIESGKLDGIEKDIADYSTAVDKFVGSSILSDANKQKALNSVKFHSLRMKTAYQIAQANASDGKVSKNDLDNAMQIIGKETDPDLIIAALNSQVQGAFLKLASMQGQLDKNPAVVDFEKRMGLKTGLRPVRIYDQIDQMPYPPEKKEILKRYMSGVNGEFQKGQAITKATADASTQQVQPQQQGPLQAVEFNGLVIPSEAIGILVSRPDERTKKFFDEQFGKGAADRVLGGK